MISRPRILAVPRYLRRFLVGAVLTYAAVALTLGGTPAARTVFQLALLALATILVVGYWRWRSDIPVSLARLELIATNVAFTLFLAELTLRAWAAWSGQTLLWSATLDAYRLKPGHHYGAGLVGNRLGYPGPDVTTEKPAGARRIVALGDSFAVGIVPFEQNYLTLLGKALLGVEVCNFGVACTGPREYHAVLQRDAWAVQPDLVLLSIFVGNDITESLPEPRYLDPRGSALYLFGERLGKLMRERQRRSTEAPPSSGPGPEPLSERRFREVEASRLRVCLSPPPASIEKHWKRALGHLDGLLADCRQRQVPIAVVLIPDEFQMNPAVLEQALHDAGAERARVDLDLPQRRLMSYFSDQDVPCLDLRPFLTPDSYAPRDTHWNERGNRLASEAIAQWMCRESVIGAVLK